jgi:hypothetical protein
VDPGREKLEVSLLASQVETRQREDEGLKPSSDKQPFASLLYQHACQLAQISSIEAGHGKRIAVQVKDVPLIFGHVH